MIDPWIDLPGCRQLLTEHGVPVASYAQEALLRLRDGHENQVLV